MLRSAVKRPPMDPGVLNILDVSVCSAWALRWSSTSCLCHRGDHAGGQRDKRRTLVNLQCAPSGQSREGPLTVSPSPYLGAQHSRQKDRGQPGS